MRVPDLRDPPVARLGFGAERVGRETREQCLKVEGKLPDVIVACVGGGSNAAGIFYPFVDDANVKLIGVQTQPVVMTLTLKDGSEILLGADRQMKPPLIGEAAAAIAARLKIAVADLGMVDGAPGVLAVVGTSVPEWSAPSLPREEIEKRVSASARAYKIMAVSATLFMLIRLIARR